MAGIGNATKHGFLVREGDALERLAAIDTITFDKTGTMTHGTPQVVAIQGVSTELTEDDVFYYLACAEARSEHPLGKAVVRSYYQSKKGNIEIVDDFTMVPGRGVKISIAGKEIIAGNLDMITENTVTYDMQELSRTDQYVKEGCTIMYLAIDKKLKGFLALSDTLRTEASSMIKKIQAVGITAYSVFLEPCARSVRAISASVLEPCARSAKATPKGGNLSC